MNKQIRKEIRERKYRKRLANYNITPLSIQNIIDRGAKANFYAFKTTGKPCSCANCSPRKIGEKSKYKYFTNGNNQTNFT